jgi:excisionase family DNA binding protein
MSATISTQDSTPSRLVSTREAAQMLEISPSTLRVLIAKGRIPVAERTRSGRNRLTVQAVRQYAAERSSARALAVAPAEALMEKYDHSRPEHIDMHDWDITGLYARGLSLAEIASHCDLSRETIRRIIQRTTKEVCA